MQPFGSKRKHLIRLIGLLVICLWAFAPLLIQIPIAQAAGQSYQEPVGYWQYVGTTTNFVDYQQTAVTVTTYFGGNSEGSTAHFQPGPLSYLDAKADCSWGFGADTQILRPGQNLDISLSVTSSETANYTGLGGQDTLQVSAFGGSGGGGSIQTKFTSTGSSVQATKQGVVTLTIHAIPDMAEENKRIEFTCLVYGGELHTVMHYQWVATATPTPTASGAVVQPTLQVQPTVTNQPTLVKPSQNGGEPPATNPAADTTGSPSILLLIGGILSGLIGTALGMAGIIALLVGGRGKGGKPGPNPDNPGYYLLQASSRTAEVRPGKPAVITFTAYHVTEEGEALPAPQADVQVEVPETPGRLAAVPPASMGSLACTFSVPDPQVCETVSITATAVIAGSVRAQVSVQVRILPTYELDLQWEDPAQGPLQVDGQEVRARAWVTATPPDPEATPDVLVQQVSINLQGPNSDWIRQPLKLYVQGETLWIPISAASPAPDATLQPENPFLVAGFSRGDQQLTARLTVNINSEAVLGAWIDGKKEAQSAYQRNQVPPGWDLPDIIAYFHARDNDEKPIKPPSNYAFDKPPFEAIPPILDQVDFYENADIPGQYVLKVALKPDTDLDTAFGDDPEEKRQVKVKVIARDETGKELSDSVTYTFRPTVSFVIHAYENDPAVRVQEHNYRALEFANEMGLVANGDDTLNLAGYFMRTDLLEKSGPDPARRLDVGDLQEVVWKLPDDANHFEAGDPELKDGFVLFNVKSTAPISASIVKDPEAPTTLITKPELDQEEGSRYTLESDQVEVDIAVQYPRLHLWVVPGIYRHTSTAIAYLDLLPSKFPLPDQDLCLSMENPDGMMLDFDDCESHQETIDKDMEKAERRGGAFWKLRYSGITWDNLPQARFKVRAGLEDPPDESWTAWAQIDVHQNLLELLSVMTSDAAFSAKVNNPNRDFILPPSAEEMEEIKNNSSLDSPNIPIDAKLKAQVDAMDHYAKVLDGKASTILKSGLPRYLRGPLYNIASCIERYSYGEDFVCNSMRNNICVWLEQRRFLIGREAPKGEALKRLEKMNGIDFGYYSRTPFHVWAGIFPAGADRFSEYRALDPWWYQYWPSAWAQPENLWTQTSEDMRLNIFTVLNWVLKLAVISLYSVEQAQQFYEVVKAWLNGTTTDDILDKVIPNTGFRAWWRYVNFDSDNAGLDGRYATGRDPEIWSKDLFKDPDPD